MDDLLFKFVMVACLSTPLPDVKYLKLYQQRSIIGVSAVMIIYEFPVNVVNESSNRANSSIALAFERNMPKVFFFFLISTDLNCRAII